MDTGEDATSHGPGLHQLIGLRMNLLTLALAGLTVFLASCATSPEHNAQMRAQQESRQRAYLEKLRQACMQYGIQPGTQQMALCVMQSDQQNQLAVQIQELADKARQDRLNEEALRNSQQIYRATPKPKSAWDK